MHLKLWLGPCIGTAFQSENFLRHHPCLARVVDHLPLNSNSQVAKPLLAPQLHSAAELPVENWSPSAPRNCNWQTGPKAEDPASAQPTMQTHLPTFQLIFRSHLHHLSISNSLRQASPRHKNEQEDSILVVQRRIHICYFSKIALADTATENPVANWELVHAWNLLIIIFVQDVLTLKDNHKHNFSFRKFFHVE